MLHSFKFRLRAQASVAALLAFGPLLAATPGLAQETVATAAPASAPAGALAAAAPRAASDSLAVNVVRRMVAKGLLSQADADELIAGAEADTARAQAAEAPIQQLPGAETPGVIRAPYIPENVRAQIKDELKSEMTQEAKAEHWALPNAFPDWASRLTVFGDLRFRDESQFYDKANANDFVNFNAINQGSPFDANGAANPPILNSTQNRNLQQVRARLGFNFAVNDQVSATIMIASGNNDSPVSTIQTFGANEEKFELWLDQAYITYRPVPGAALVFGRAPNPFVSTEILWKQDDFQLDGVSAHYGHDIPWVNGLFGYLTLGAYPLDYADNALPTALSTDKPSSSKDKYLFAGQLGGAYRITPRLTASLNLGYYDFSNARGELSPACLNTADFCETDNTRPAFMQKGNTLFALRNLVADNPSSTAIPQFFGLASDYRDLDVLTRLDYAVNDKLHVALTGDYTQNLAYDAAAILARDPVTNTGCSLAVPSGQTCQGAGGKTTLQSGDVAWLARLSVGAPRIVDRWDWNLALAYAYIAPDAVVDAFDDNDFRGGGTNSRGWILEGDLGVARNTWIALKYLSADVIYGAPYSEDKLQFDINARF
jgi:hypothetical protein